MAILYGILYNNLAFTSNYIINMDVWCCMAFTIHYCNNFNIIFIWKFIVSIISIKINQNYTAINDNNINYYYDILLL
jgi:hypothetical protein